MPGGPAGGRATGSTCARPSPATCRSSRWLPAYDKADLRFDAIAGIVSWGVMVPVAMAYAGLAGMPPETGLVTAFAAMTAYAVFGTSRHLKVTASSSVAIMSASVVVAHRGRRFGRVRSRSARRSPCSSGSSSLVAGAARLGFLSQFLAASVVTGFVIGLAVTITVGQIPALLGIPSVSGTIIEKLVADRRQPRRAERLHGGARDRLGDRDPRPQAHRAADPRRPRRARGRDRAVESPSTSRRRASTSSATCRPASRCRASRRSRFGDVVFLVAGAFGIVFLALAESIGAARSFAVRHGYEIDPDQELIALGAANAAAGLFGGFAVDASFSQSATGEAAGNRTQLVVAHRGRPDPCHRDRPRPDLRQPAAGGPVRDRDRLGREPGQPGRAAPLSAPGSGPTSCWR